MTSSAAASEADALQPASATKAVPKITGKRADFRPNIHISHRGYYCELLDHGKSAARIKALKSDACCCILEQCAEQRKAKCGCAIKRCVDSVEWHLLVIQVPTRSDARCLRR